MTQLLCGHDYVYRRYVAHACVMAVAWVVAFAVRLTIGPLGAHESVSPTSPKPLQQVRNI
jgi:hypothetical protein